MGLLHQRVCRTVRICHVSSPVVFILARALTIGPPTRSRLWLGFGTSSRAACLSPSGHGVPLCARKGTLRVSFGVLLTAILHLLLVPFESVNFSGSRRLSMLRLS